MENELLEKLFTKVVDMDEYMKEHMATKEELRTEVDKLITHMDGFIKLHETLDTELAALRGKCDRLEGRIEVLERRVFISS